MPWLSRIACRQCGFFARRFWAMAAFFCAPPPCSLAIARSGAPPAGRRARPSTAARAAPRRCTAPRSLAGRSRRRGRGVHSTGSAPASQTARAPASSAAHDARTRTRRGRSWPSSASATSSDVSGAAGAAARRGGRGGGRGVGGDTDEGVGDGSDGVAFEDQRDHGGVARRRLHEHRHRPPRNDGAAAPTRRRLRDGEVSGESTSAFLGRERLRPPPGRRARL